MLSQIKKQVLNVAKKMYHMQLTTGTSGNVSARDIQSGLIAVTPSAVPYETLQMNDIVIVDLNGVIIHGKHKPSSEIPMHLAVYRRRADVNGIVHTHSLFATVFSVLNKGLPAVTVPMASLGHVPVVPFALPGSEDLAFKVSCCLGSTGKVVLLQNHGVLCACETVETALECAVYTEEGAKVAYFSHIAGGLNPISDKHINMMINASRKGQVL